MSEAESAHGKLSKVDREWGSTRFMVLFCVTVATALLVIYTISSNSPFSHGAGSNWSYQPLAHDPVQHSLQSSTM
ncbi:MAG: hypothetical protein H6719_36650 [Sandaracinaceae bacterium]|nr:hypothetical protein [Sandaracinaceae bacterium]